MKNNIKILDCTFRDGGYYNNWNFNKKIIQKYLNEVGNLNINYIELGFRFLDEIKTKGRNAYTTDDYVNSFKIPNKINVGIMINASDLFLKKKPLENIKKLVSSNNKSKIKFIRLACHYHEIFYLKECISWLKKQNLKVFLNLMQISEIKESQIKKVTKYLKTTKIDVLYLADSLGSLNPNKIKKIVKNFKLEWKSDLGFHAHNNLGLALKNSLEANKYGVRWIDCTINGMGRGPGNLVTQDLIINLDNRIKKTFSKPINYYFYTLKKYYKWGTNKYYLLAAKNKIHPTYIQRMLSDKRYNKSNYLSIINSLKKVDSSKYNPISHFKHAFFSNKKLYFNKPIQIKNYDKILILGPGKTVDQKKNEIENFIKNNKVLVIVLNTTKSINEKLINLRVACHPLRIISDILIYKKLKTPIVLPYSSFKSNIKKLIKKNKINFIDYGLKLDIKNKVNVSKNYCTLPNPLAIGYALSLVAKTKKKLILAGFDGYDLDNPESDNSKSMIKLFIKKYLKYKPYTLTPSNYSNLFLNLNHEK